MQRTFIRLSHFSVCIVAAAWVAGFAMAQPTPQPAPPSAGDRPSAADARRPGPPGLGQAIEQLELTDAQKPAVDAALREYRAKEQQVRAELLQQMKTTLTAAQFTKFESAMNQRPMPPPMPPRRAEGEANRLPTVANPVQKAPACPNAVTFSGGYETAQQDHGRPVSLIAAALKVPTEVFRDAFSGVTPASGGAEPEPHQVQLNKQALLKVLTPYGVTNDRLDAVSNQYRYNGRKGETWQHTPASATAIIRDGVVTGFVIQDGGSGYSSFPNVAVEGFPNLKTTVVMTYGEDFKTNGSVKEIKVNDSK